MPPKRPKKATGAGTSASHAAPPGAPLGTPPPSGPPPEAALVARCSRLDLEALVLASLQKGQPVRMDDVQAAVDRETAPKRAAPVTSTESMEGAGLFSTLPTDLLVQILEGVTLQTRLTFAIEICTGLRPLRGVPALWTRIMTSTRPTQYSHYESIYWINGRGLRRLAEWVPDRSQVTDLELHVSKGANVFAPEDTAAVIAMFPQVRRLRVTGAAVVKAVLVSMAKVERPALRELTLEFGQTAPATVLALLAKCPNLDRLCATQLNTTVAEGYAALQRTARHGGTPVLTRLHHMQQYSDKLSVFDGCLLGARYPELKELGISFELMGPSPHLPSTPLHGPNLRRLHLHKMCRSFGPAEGAYCHLSSGCLGAVLRLLVSKCPRLEALCLCHGRKYLSRGEALPPLPHLGATFTDGSVELPRTLVMLHLQDIHVSPPALETCALPELVLLRLIGCGPDAQATADAMRASAAADGCACPRLTEEGVVLVESENSSYNSYAYPKFEGPDAAANAARNLSKYTKFPLGDFEAGMSLSGVVDVLDRSAF